MVEDLTNYRDMKLSTEHNVEEVIEIENKLFPWLSDDLSWDSFKIGSMANSKGIVMTVGNFYFPYAVHNIKILRSLGCDLPIEIFHGGESDLSKDKLEHLQSFKDVNVYNIYSRYDGEKIVLEKYDYKAFSIVASSFKEVLFVDADVVFLTDPSSMFSDDEYLKSGALFFHDRFLNFGTSGERWLRSLMPAGREFSQKAKDGPFWRKKSRFQLESGTMLFNKEKHWFGLLMTLKLNTGDGKMQMSRQTYGDKETFWIALELAGEDYGYYDAEAGVIGKKVGGNRLKGNIIHTHPDGRIFWIQGGIVIDKHNRKLQDVTNSFTHMTDPSVPYEWKGYSSVSPCIPIPQDQKDLIAEFSRIYKADPLK